MHGPAPTAAVAVFNEVQICRYVAALPVGWTWPCTRNAALWVYDRPGAGEGAARPGPDLAHGRQATRWWTYLTPSCIPVPDGVHNRCADQGWSDRAVPAPDWWWVPASGSGLAGGTWRVQAATAAQAAPC